jgi:hypothetical protein
MTTSQPIDDQSHVAHKENEIDQDSLLHKKIDTLVSEFREFRLQSKCEKDAVTNHPLWAAHPKCASEVSELLLKWPEIKNVIDIVNSTSHIRFFAGNEKEGALSVIRCETCCRYLLERKNGHTRAQTTPTVIAKKGLGR